jgi:hypothetical protein
MTNSGELNLQELEKARLNLGELSHTINDIKTRVLDNVFPMLSPFIFDTYQELDAKILIELLESALSELNIIEKDFYKVFEHGHNAWMNIEKAAPTLIIFDSGVQVKLNENIPKPSSWFIVPSDAVPEAIISKRDNGSLERLQLPPGKYDLYWKQDYDHTPLLLIKGLIVEQGKITEVNADSGVKLNIAPWIPKFDNNGWWGVTKAGETPDKVINWTKSENALVLPPGQYDLYWKQNFDHTPLLLIKGFTVEQGKITEVNADSGVKLNIAPWIPKFDNNGWWGVTKAGETPDRVINWTKSENALVLPPGQYDLYWKQNFDHTPLLLAKGFTVEQGKLIEVNADSGVKLILPPDTPPLDSNYGWWGVVLAGEKPDNLISWSRKSDHPLLVPTGTYDIFWKQNYSQNPLRVKENMSINKGKLIEIEVQTPKV